MECNIKKNISDCNCTYSGCPRHGLCCECLRYHRAKNALPACYFSAEDEKTYNRSLDYFFSVYKK